MATVLRFSMISLAKKLEKIDRAKMQEIATVENNSAKMRERLNSVLTDKIEYSSIGKVENGMTFQVANIKNDDNYTYFKLIIINNTGSDYNIDGIYFKGCRGKAQRDEKARPKLNRGLKSSLNHLLRLSPLTKNRAWLCNRTFYRSKEGSVIIQLRELKGTRNPIIEISGEKII